MIGFEAADGAVLRILGLVERRGYVVRGIAMAEQNSGAASMTLDVEPRDQGRSIDVLELQLTRLQEVRSISHFPPVQGPNS